MRLPIEIHRLGGRWSEDEPMVVMVDESMGRLVVVVMSGRSALCNVLLARSHGCARYQHGAR